MNHMTDDMGAVTPPPAGPDGLPREPARRKRHPWRWVAAIVGVLAVAGVIGIFAAAVASLPSPDSQVTGQAAPSPASSAPASSAPAKPAPSMFGLPLHSTVTVHDGLSGDVFRVRVNSVAPYTPGAYDYAQADAGTHLIVADVTYHAVKGSADPNPYDWQTKDASGQTYDSQVTGASTELTSNTIAAGQTARGQVVLEIPDSSLRVPAGSSTGDTIVYTAGLSETASWEIPAGL